MTAAREAAAVPRRLLPNRRWVAGDCASVAVVVVVDGDANVVAVVVVVDDGGDGVGGTRPAEGCSKPRQKKSLAATDN